MIALLTLAVHAQVGAHVADAFPSAVAGECAPPNSCQSPRVPPSGVSRLREETVLTASLAQALLSATSFDGAKFWLSFNWAGAQGSLELEPGIAEHSSG